MAIFDSVKNKISTAGQTTVRKAMDLTEITKLQGTVSASQEQLRGLYAELGSQAYRIWKEEPLPEVEDKVREITGLLEKVERCRTRILALQDMKQCPQCGAKAEKDALFCSVCGCRLPAEAPAKAAFCTVCGAAVSEDALFCTVCGNKVG